MVILTKPKCSKPKETPRVIAIRKPNSKSVLKYVLHVRPILHTGQIGWTYPRASSVHWTCPVPLPDSRDIYWTCPILDQLSLMNNMTVGI
jgi:hypothetical protein